jgi:hypothetical protein
MLVQAMMQAMGDGGHVHDIPFVFLVALKILNT